MATQVTQQLSGASKKFRLILREGGIAREMGGEDSTVGVSIVDRVFTEALDQGGADRVVAVVAATSHWTSLP